MRAYLITFRNCDAVVAAAETPWEAVQKVMRAYRAEPDPEDRWDGDETDLEQLQELGEFVGA